MPDDDIARLLPEPPPPRATRREAAIGAAMRRFDGVEGPAARPRPATAWQRPAWTRPSRTQIGAFASIALVAAVGLPLALNTLERERQLAPRAPVPASAVAERATTPSAAQGAVATPSPQGAAARQRAPASRLAGETAAGGSPALPAPPPEAPIEDCGKGDCVAAVRGLGDSGRGPFASMKRASESPAAADRDIVTSGFRAARPAPPPAARARDESEGEDIIITASRSTRPAASYRRGDWNACTVNDPGETLDGCKRLVDPGAKGAAGQAAAHVSEGLSRAWHSDLDGAVSEFDAAIALQPRLAIAYLNRGLAYQRLGEPDRALADLNRAVRYAPYAARNYYARSLYFRQKGDIDRARADEERAAERDARYRAVVE
jgi:hypothetical protein